MLKDEKAFDSVMVEVDVTVRRKGLVSLTAKDIIDELIRDIQGYQEERAGAWPYEKIYNRARDHAGQKRLLDAAEQERAQGTQKPQTAKKGRKNA